MDGAERERSLKAPSHAPRFYTQRLQILIRSIIQTRMRTLNRGVGVILHDQ